MTTTPFVGLTMPVFNAFGFFSEENAVKFALDQMEQFISGLHASMSRETQVLMPHFGLDQQTQGVHLARSLETENDIYITWHLKPNTMRMAIHQTNRALLTKAFKAIQANHSVWMSGLEELPDTWELRLQQLEYNPETNEATHYKDVFNDKVSNLTAVESAELIDRMLYLNGEDKWLGTIQLVNKVPSEFVAAMSAKVNSQFAEQLDDMLPLLRMIAGGVKVAGRKLAKGKKSRTTVARKKGSSTSATEIADKKTEQFTYNAQLKPLHIRKGFINMTSAHWPFFVINSRTTIREITLRYDGTVDKDSTVWRLVPDDTARLVLSDKAHRWLEDNFVSNDEVQIHATKLNRDIEIEIALVQSE